MDVVRSDSEEMISLIHQTVQPSAPISAAQVLTQGGISLPYKSTQSSHGAHSAHRTHASISRYAQQIQHTKHTFHSLLERARRKKSESD